MTEEEPTFYVMGEEVQVRGFAFEPRESRSGGDYIHTMPIIQFPEEEQTTQLDAPVQLKVEGGLSAVYEYARENNMLPDWVIDNEMPPWERDN